MDLCDVLLAETRQVRKEATVGKVVRACSNLPGVGIAKGDDMYKVLARKYRPAKLDEIIGQDVAVRILKNAINSNKLHHAILLSGPMGTGKTSTARIIAKSLNCEKGPTDEPCNKCESCISIAQGNNIDVVEIDGASNRKVDDARAIIESVKYPPLKSRYKIYIVDEVHMLTQEAFNALLKTIEEPPDYIKFIFATTAIEKVPDTILSRCQIITLKKIPQDLIKQKLKRIAENEHVSIEDGALDIIALSSFGSMRVAEGYLDRCIAYKPDNLSTNDISKVIGVTDSETIKKYFSYILSRDAKSALELIKTLDEQDTNFEIFVGQCIEHLLFADMTVEQKTNLLNIYYRSMLDLKQNNDSLTVLNVTTYKAASLANLEKIETIIEKLLNSNISEINLQDNANKLSSEQNSLFCSDNNREIKYSSVDDNTNTDIKINDSNLKLILEEFDGKIISIEKLKK